jgi:tetratricopeptide (TPR) repeat protein
VADWLIQQGSGRTSEIIGLIADHLEQAERGEQALAYLRQAGEQAAAQFANQEAIHYFTRALNLAPQADAHTRLDLLLLREDIYALQADRPAQEKDLTEMQQLAEGWAMTARKLRCCCGGRYAQQTSNYSIAITWARQAAWLAHACSSPHIRAAAHLEQGRALYRQASYVEAAVQLEQALMLAEEQPNIAADILQTLVIVNLHQGKQGFAAPSRTGAADRPADWRPADRANVLASVGATLNDRGSHAQAQHYLNQALAVFQEIGDRHGRAVALQRLGWQTTSCITTLRPASSTCRLGRFIMPPATAWAWPG